MHTISHSFDTLGSFPDIIPWRAQEVYDQTNNYIYIYVYMYLKSCWIIHVKNSLRGSKVYSLSVVYLDLAGALLSVSFRHSSRCSIRGAERFPMGTCRAGRDPIRLGFGWAKDGSFFLGEVHPK